jgi:hypothetical protein
MLATLKQHLLTLTLLTCATLLSGCDLENNNSDNSPVITTPLAPAVVQTIDPGYASSEVLFLDPANQQVSSPYFSKTKSDYTLATNGSDIYHIGKFYIDTIDKYAAEDYYNPAWAFTTQDNADSISRNPYNLIFASDTKAYLIRYDSPKVWIVNPNAVDFQSFKIGEIDLSVYIPTDNSSTPNPATAVISQGKLFITMQRLATGGLKGNPAYVAVFDTNTEQEIETNSDATDNLKGIKLAGIDPLENSMVTGPDGKIYVTTHGVYGSTTLTNSRIEEIDPDTYALRTILTAANISNNVNKFINASVIVSADKGYFYAGKVVFTPTYGEISNLYEFNPTTGAIIASEVAGTGNEHINYLGLDKKGMLWLSMINPSTPGVDIIDSETNTLVGDRLLTPLNPNVIRFLD